MLEEDFMKRNIDVAVSTDPILDYQNIIEYAKFMQGVADFLHCDIMNENFVSKNTFDYGLVKSINRNSLIMLDVHLMQNEPWKDVPAYIDSGANIITVHYEAFEDKETLVSTLEYIKSRNALAGLSIKPQTPFKDIRSFVFNCDILLIMGVEPGQSGQETIPEAIEKVREADKFRADNNLKFKIEFDGGVNENNSKTLVEAGVDILVSGSYVYQSKDRKKAIEKLKEE